ncbi:glycosyltransferase family 4 protein [Listeria aquatica]|uniref:Glycosyltransferase family 4 protein n=2 Tax=Listeria aquatica TaxID=1494960 RepID=A0A841ZQ93_9LIST|nr:glycosyltransferase family 4 protein [Listeria aquatica]
MKKRILIITQNFPPEIGSAANRMKGICQALNEVADVTVWTTEPHYPQKDLYRQADFWEELPQDIKIRRIKTTSANFEQNFLRRFLLYLEVLFCFFKLIIRETETYDIVFVTSPPLSVPFIGLLAKRKFKANFVVDIRDLWPETLRAVKGIFPKLLRYLSYPIEKHIYHRADKLIINSEGFTEYIQKIVGDKRKIYFLPNGLTDFELKLAPASKKEEKITIVYTGNMGIAQDIDSLFHLAESFQRNKKARFLLIGYGRNYMEIQQKINEKGFENIIIKPPESRKRVWKRLQEADIAYIGLKEHPVFETVMPGKVIDYMGASLPIIGVASGYSKRIIEEAHSGVVFHKEDQHKITEKLAELIESQELRKFYGKNGNEYAQQNFNWQTNKGLLYKFIFED